MSTEVKEVQVRGQPAFMLDLRIDGARKRRYFPSRLAAEDFLKSQGRQEKVFGQEWVKMDPAERLDVARILAEIKAANFTLREVWDGFKQSRAGLPAPLTEITLAKAIPAFCDSLLARGVRERYVSNVESVLGLFARGREEMLVSQLTPAVFQEWFDARRDYTTETLRGEKTRFVGFCNWAIRNGYLREGTIKYPTPASSVELRKGGKGLIAIVTPGEAKALLALTVKEAPSVLVYLTLAMFSGVRPEEVGKLVFADLDLASRHIILDHHKTKTRWARIAPIPENAVTWLKLAKKLGHWGKPEDPVAPPLTTLANVRFRKWVKVLANGWQQDILRHSCASYFFQKVKSLDEVAKALGNTPDVLRDNYLRPVTDAATQEFYSLRPENCAVIE